MYPAPSHCVMSGRVWMCAAPSLRYVLAQGNVCCFASLSGHMKLELYLHITISGHKKYLMYQHRAATHCYRLPSCIGHCP